MNVPDVVGFTLKDAGKMLNASGFNVHTIIVTAPPRRRDLRYDDNSRVIRLRVIDGNKVELLVCTPDKE